VEERQGGTIVARRRGATRAQPQHETASERTGRQGPGAASASKGVRVPQNTVTRLPRHLSLPQPLAWLAPQSHQRATHAPHHHATHARLGNCPRSSTSVCCPAAFQRGSWPSKDRRLLVGSKRSRTPGCARRRRPSAASSPGRESHRHRGGCADRRAERASHLGAFQKRMRIEGGHQFRRERSLRSRHRP
jgi:hypothetical protein